MTDWKCFMHTVYMYYDVISSQLFNKFFLYSRCILKIHYSVILKFSFEIWMPMYWWAYDIVDVSFFPSQSYATLYSCTKMLTIQSFCSRSIHALCAGLLFLTKNILQYLLVADVMLHKNNVYFFGTGKL